MTSKANIRSITPKTPGQTLKRTSLLEMLVENGTEKQASYFLDGCPSSSETHELAGSVLSVPYDPSLKGGSVRSGPALTSNSFARTDSNRA